MTLPALKKNIYEALKPNLSDDQKMVEAKFSILHVSYLILISGSELNDDLLSKVLNVFKALCTTFLQGDQVLKVCCDLLISL